MIDDSCITEQKNIVMDSYIIIVHGMIRINKLNYCYKFYISTRNKRLQAFRTDRQKTAWPSCDKCFLKFYSLINPRCSLQLM